MIRDSDLDEKTLKSEMVEKDKNWRNKKLHEIHRHFEFRPDPKIALVSEALIGL